MPLQNFLGLPQNTGEGGIKAIIYTDNGIAAFQGFENVESVSALIRNDLLSAGFVINNEKSDLNPKRKGKWLGVRRDSFTGKNYKIFRGYKQVFVSRVFDPKAIVKGSRTTFFYAFGIRPITSSFY